MSSREARHMGIRRCLVAVVAGCALAPASAHATLFSPAPLPPQDAGAHSTLVRSERIGGDVQRLSYRYGPLEAVAGQNLILVGPVTIEKPPAGNFVVRAKPGLVGIDGKTPPVEQV